MEDEKMKKYEEPELQIIIFESANIVTESNNLYTPGSNIGGAEGNLGWGDL